MDGTNANRYICIHGHFYQPPRENPWLEEIELQDSAYPFHDWNERINEECYAPNTASRILSPDNMIIDISNNYKKMSFDFGPTLLSWLCSKAPETYKAIVEADRESKFSGHSPAMAQAYNHLIMPLANPRDKRTQVKWGIKDFERRFGRKPEGMWLPECAVDKESLDIMVEHGIKFVVLAPHQFSRFRKIGDEQWKDSKEADLKMPYLCRLPSGRTISAFFYFGPASQDTAFANVLDNGELLAKRLLSEFSENGPQIVSIATDGETYGHHHKQGDMALAYCFYYLESNNLANVTIFAEYLEKFPPTHEAEIAERTSWSCVHGVERWMRDCGDNSGTHPGWSQGWRTPLRWAMDWLRDALIPIYEKEASVYLKDPWAARDAYIDILLDRSTENVDRFFSQHATRELSLKDKVRVLKLLEMQRHAMLMFTSDGWFFDEISGIETTQVMKYAARAMQMANELAGADLEPGYTDILRGAKSNIPEFKDGANVYRMFVKPAAVDINRVAAHYAISSIFEEYPETVKIYSYRVKKEAYDLQKLGEQSLAVGKIHVRSDVTWEEETMNFAVLHFGDHNINGGVQRFWGEEPTRIMQKDIKDAFAKGDIPEVIRMMDKHFGAHSYSLWHLFKDQQRKIFGYIMEANIKEIDESLRRIYDHHSPAIQVMRDLGIPLPDVLNSIGRFLVNADLRAVLEDPEMNLARLKQASGAAKRYYSELDRATLGFIAGNKITALMEKLRGEPEDLGQMEALNELLATIEPLQLGPNLWKAQNILFSISRSLYQQMKERTDKGDEAARRWMEQFAALESRMYVRTH
jgi:alpha-amylase/alpha-mannosidase (GH57 family)